MKKNIDKNYSLLSTFFLKLITIISLWFKKPSTNRKITILLIFLSFVASIITYLVFTNSLPYIKTTPTIAITTVSIDVILLLVLCFKVIRKIIQTWADRSKGKVGSKISTKFILTFALLVLIPTITLSIFSSLFFNISMKGWFNERVLRIAEQSNIVAEAYYKEHLQNIKSDASTMGKEIDEKFNTIFLDLNKLNNFIYTQIKLRELTEAFIFRKGGAVLAKGGFTISTTPDVITGFDLIEAETGEIVLTSKRKDRVRALIKLQNIQNTYLSVGRFIDPQIIAQIQSVKDESMVYKKLYEQKSKIQTNFSDIAGKDYLKKQNPFPTGKKILVTDLLAKKDKLYIAYVKRNIRQTNQDSEGGCFDMSVLRANLDLDKMVFEEFFSTNECQPLSLGAEGGKLSDFTGNKILLTIGDYSAYEIQWQRFSVTLYSKNIFTLL